MSDELDWTKSSYSDSEGAACVEFAALAHAVLVRDSKTPGSPHLHLHPVAWADFLRLAVE